MAGRGAAGAATGFCDLGDEKGLRYRLRFWLSTLQISQPAAAVSDGPLMSLSDGMNADGMKMKLQSSQSSH